MFRFLLLGQEIDLSHQLANIRNNVHIGSVVQQHLQNVCVSTLSGHGQSRVAQLKNNTKRLSNKIKIQVARIFVGRLLNHCGAQDRNFSVPDPYRHLVCSSLAQLPNVPP